MSRNMENFREYLDASHSMYHAVEQLTRMLEEDGYTCLPENCGWELIPGEKYYVTRGMSTLIAFRIPVTCPTGFMMSASHCDRPSFKVKENGEISDRYTRLSVETYGGALLGTWLDRPLSIAGRVTVDTPTGVRSRLLDIDRDLLLIPNVAIHMNRSANEGCKWNPAVDLQPLMGSAAQKGKLSALLAQEAGGEILGSDLYLYVREGSSLWGIGEEYISAPALDDLGCVWCCAQGFLDARPTDSVPVLCVFDSEEVGSGSVQGAGSQMLSDVLDRICKCMDLEKGQMLSQSFMLSADNAHAVHPNHPEYADAHNAPVMGQGVVLKYNGNLSYTTDGVAAAIFRKICAQAGVPVQTYYNRADLRGGSTLGRISLGNVSVLSADIGMAQLAMHSCYETMSAKDVEYMADALRSFYSCTLTQLEDGAFRLG